MTIKPLARAIAMTGLTFGILIQNMPWAVALEITRPRGVVELFTSQGCSSCPAADRVLSRFNEEGDILGLSIHVDYWDRLGWKDTFASHANTERQWAYARALGERQVYTPQAIVNGRAHHVGSRKEQIEARIRDFQGSEKGLHIPIDVSRHDGAVRVSVAPDERAHKATLYVFYFNPSEEVAIKRGENSGKTLNYSNVVGKVDMVGMVDATGLVTTFSVAELARKGFSGCALILQASTKDGDPGPILGATVISDL